MSGVNQVNAVGNPSFREGYELALAQLRHQTLIVLPDTSFVDDILKYDAVAGIILPTKNDEIASRYPGKVGWIDTSTGDIHIPPTSARTIAGFFYIPIFSLQCSYRLRAAGISWVGYYSSRSRKFVFVRLFVTIARRVANVLWRRGLVAIDHGTRRLHSVSKGADNAAYSFAEVQWRRLLKGIVSDCKKHALPESSFDQQHVMIVTGSLGAGGSERQVSYTAKGISERVGKMTLAVQSLEAGGDFYLPSVQSASINIIQVPRPENLFDCSATIQQTAFDVYQRLGHNDIFAQQFVQFCQLFVRERPGVVHCWLDWPNCIAGLAALTLGVPRIVLSCRSLAPTHFNFFQPFMLPIYRDLLNSERVTMLNNSEAGAVDYARWLGIDPVRIRVINNAVHDSEHVTPPADQVREYRRKLGIPDGARVLGSIFRFAPEKRVGLWIDIAAAVAAKRPDLWFLLAGDGPEQAAALAKARTLGLGDRFVMPGKTTKPALELALMDCFLLTSRVEGLPNAILEAQLSGVPVVTSAVGGAPEAIAQIGVSGYAIDSNNPHDYVDPILRLVSGDSADIQRREQLTALVKQRFAMDRMISETLNTYGF